MNLDKADTSVERCRALLFMVEVFAVTASDWIVWSPSSPPGVPLSSIDFRFGILQTVL